MAKYIDTFVRIIKRKFILVFLIVYTTETKSKRKLKGQSGMNNPETLTTLVTQDTEQKQTKQKIQHRNPQR
jgi:hypothetical protein